MSILIVRTIYMLTLWFTGYYDENLVVNEIYFDWYYANNIVEVEPNIYFNGFLSGLGIIILFVQFYYVNI